MKGVYEHVFYSLFNFAVDQNTFIKKKIKATIPLPPQTLVITIGKKKKFDMRENRMINKSTFCCQLSQRITDPGENNSIKKKLVRKITKGFKCTI